MFRNVTSNALFIKNQERVYKIVPNGMIKAKRYNEFMISIELCDSPIMTHDENNALLWIEADAYNDFKWTGRTTGIHNHIVALDNDCCMTAIPVDTSIEILYKTCNDLVYFSYHGHIHCCHENSVRVSQPRQPIMLRVESIDGLQVRVQDSILHSSYVHSKIVGHLSFQSIILVDRRSFLNFSFSPMKRDMNQVMVWFIYGTPNYFVLFQDTNLSVMGYPSFLSDDQKAKYTQIEQQQEYPGRDKCLLCLERVPTMAYVHGGCAHMISCQQCHEHHHNNELIISSCPICRKPIDQIIRIF